MSDDEDVSKLADWRQLSKMMEDTQQGNAIYYCLLCYLDVYSEMRFLFKNFFINFKIIIKTIIIFIEHLNYFLTLNFI